MTSEISVTIKGGPEYDAPWVVLKGTVTEVGDSLAEFRQRGLFGAVKAATEEFKAAPVRTTAEAVKVLNDAGIATQELPADQQPCCPECGAKGVAKKGHSTNKNRDYRGIFCSKECGAKPIEFEWTS